MLVCSVVMITPTVDTYVPRHRSIYSAVPVLHTMRYVYTFIVHSMNEAYVPLSMLLPPVYNGHRGHMIYFSIMLYSVNIQYKSSDDMYVARQRRIMCMVLSRGRSVYNGHRRLDMV